MPDVWWHVLVPPELLRHLAEWVLRDRISAKVGPQLVHLPARIFRKAVIIFLGFGFTVSLLRVLLDPFVDVAKPSLPVDGGCVTSPGLLTTFLNSKLGIPALRMASLKHCPCKSP